TLRAAIQEANALSGTQTIRFSIPSAGVQTIQPAAALPAITDPVVVDGYSQPGAAPNTLPSGSDAVLLIQLSGANVPGAAALTFGSGADGSSVRGLVINDGFGVGIAVSGAPGVVIQGNYIGTDAAGTTAVPNGAFGLVNAGIYVDNTPNTQIGGASPDARNVIAGNNGDGIALWQAGTSGTVIQGNYVGVGADGDSPLGNGGSGGSFGVVGGGITLRNFIANTLIAGNRIANNGPDGIVDFSGSSTVIQGNTIESSSANGILLGGFGHTVGGTAPGEGNVITANGGDGIRVTGSGIAIRGNAVSGNAGLGIDLGGDGPTPNDFGDVDAGSNNLQNYPLLTAAVVAGDLVVDYGLDSLPPFSAYDVQIDLYRADDAASGEGQLYLGSAALTAPGVASVNLGNAAALGVGIGDALVATATDAGGNTSEFGLPARVAVTVDSLADGADANPGDGQCATALGECTLRAAVEETNLRAGADRITFVPTLNGTIPLTAGQLDVVDALTIAGPGANAVTVSAGGASRIVNVAAAGQPVTISHLTFADGTGLLGGMGGAIVSDGSLTIHDAAFINNSTPGSGGAIHASGTLTLTDVLFEANAALFGGTGGAVSIDNGSLTISGGQLISNTATNLGGAVFVNIGSADLADTLIQGNQAASGGGGLYLTNFADLTLTDSQVVGNTAGGSGGGGLLVSGSTTLLRTEVRDNTISGTWGAGILNYGALAITDSTFSGNVNPTNNGGAIFNWNPGSLAIAGSTFNNNTAANAGGAILSYSLNDVTLLNSTLTENSAGNVGGGNAIYLQSAPGGALFLTNVTLANNGATGVGLAAESGTTVEILNSLLVNGGAQNCGIASLTDLGGSFQFPGATCGAMPTADPLLGPLRDNGGHTHTMALSAGSPAIGGGTQSCPPTDQRGVARPAGVSCDSGAYQVGNGARETSASLTAGLLITDTALSTNDLNWYRLDVSIPGSVISATLTSVYDYDLYLFAPEVSEENGQLRDIGQQTNIAQLSDIAQLSNIAQ
ncbi:MAG: right-handed parallel beta-helix repeat-containing protein, partial [Caldilineaceae bacterium]|nr:right-handed parallel beta-helix repeat-containing protein [Caldilineaceae bacterium]